MESLLKKTFKEKDLQRARNLITGQYGASTQTVVGYRKIEEEHKEGDVWTESDGKTWTMEDGLKVSVSKLQKARDLAMIPLSCPKCGKPMNTRLDKKMFPIHGICFECVTKMEDSLRRAGLYKQYEQEMMKGNIEGFARELRERVKDLAASQDVGVVNGEGEVEDWGRVSTEVLESLNEWSDILLDKVK